MIYYLLLSLVLILVTYKILKIRNLPPGPCGLPIIGYLPWLNAEAPYLTLTELSKTYGDIYGLHLGNVYSVFLTDPKLIKTLFSKESTTGRAPLYLTHGIMKGYGLICAEGDLWKDQRKFIHNCLKQLGVSRNKGSIRNYMESLIEEHVSEFLKSIEDVGLGTPIDPLPLLRHSMGSIINCIVFGKCWSKVDKTWEWLQHLQEEGTKYIGIAGPLNFLPFMRFIPKYKATMRFLLDGQAETHKFYQTLIEEQMKQLDDFEENDTPTNIIQAFLLERKKRQDDTVEKFYNQQQFYHLLADVFGASLDTTLTTLRWYLLFLAKHQDIQQSVRIEVQENLHNRSPSLNEMSQLLLLQASICETQRLRSVVPIGIPHGTLEELMVEGYRIPKGTMLVPLQWAMHMNETVWDKPENFYPNRFLDENGQLKKVEHFMPFQVGKRMCVGEELAKMLLFFFGATIVQTFSISLEDEAVDLNGECGITLTPKSHKLIFKRV